MIILEWLNYITSRKNMQYIIHIYKYIYTYLLTGFNKSIICVWIHIEKNKFLEGKQICYKLNSYKVQWKNFQSNENQK